LNEATSGELFDAYLKRLDPQHEVFLQSDIDLFSEDRGLLCRKMMTGDVSFAFTVFQCFLTRFDEFARFADEYVKTNIDFSADEVFLLDHSKSPWPKTKEEQRDRWRKLLKNNLLSATIQQKSDEAERQEKSAILKSPQEKILMRLRQTGKNYHSMNAMKVFEMYLVCFTEVYDPHSAYMSPKSNEEFSIAMSLSLVGIGAVLSQEDGYTKILEIVPGSPADINGTLQPEDRIIEVQQENGPVVDIVGMPLDEVVSMIRGKENSKVTLTYLEGKKGLHGIPKKVTLTRHKIMLKESEVKGETRKVTLPDGSQKNIGIITIPSFYLDFDAVMNKKPAKSVYADVRSCLERFTSDKEKIDGLIIDLRSNGGGSLTEVISICGLFIPSGPAVQIREKKRITVEKDNDSGAIMYKGDMIVLTNRFSASASEIFAAAMKDYGRCIVVGDERTHGKGTVQTMVDLDRFLPFFRKTSAPGGTMKYTNAKYYRITGESTQLKGVESDIVLPSYTDILKDFGEAKLDHALQWDTIRAAPFQKYASSERYDRILPLLRKNSEKRIDADPEFKVFRKEIELAKKIQERKELSLNFEQRWNEYSEEKK